MFGVRRFHQYHYGRRLTLVSNHKPSLAVLGPKKGILLLAAARLQCWEVMLSSYTNENEYKTMQDNGNVARLSRLPLQKRSSGELCESTTVNMFEIETLP